MRARSRENNYYEENKLSNDLRRIRDVLRVSANYIFGTSVRLQRCYYTYVHTYYTSYVLITYRFFDPTRVMEKYSFDDLKFFIKMH